MEEKRFDEWINLKEKLHFNAKAPRISEGEVWWCSFGENVGVEIKFQKLTSRQSKTPFVLSIDKNVPPIFRKGGWRVFPMGIPDILSLYQTLSILSIKARKTSCMINMHS